jgi:lysophospholipase L1-like esterase
MRNKSLISAVLLVLASLSAAQATDTVRSADFDLVVSSDGAVWMGRIDGANVALSRWTGGAWLDEQQIKVAGETGSIKLVPLERGLAAVWTELRGADSGIALAVLRDSELRVSRPAGMRGEFRELAAAMTGDGRIALLLVHADGTDSLHYCEIDPVSITVRNPIEIKGQGEISHPSLISDSQVWLVWQERTKAGLNLAAVQVLSGAVGNIKRFRVKGFGGSASPVLARALDGSVVLVWQGTSSGYQAALHARSLSEDGLGPVHRAELPEGISGVLSPATAAGNRSIVTVYGWGGGREGQWFGVKYTLEAGGGFRYELRGLESGDILEPKLAADGDGNELWVSRSGGDGREDLTTNDGDKLKWRTVKGGGPSASAPGAIYALAFGDSITEGKEVYDGQSILTRGYLPYLEAIYGSRIAMLQIIQDGVGGTTTTEGLVRLPSSLAENPYYKFVLILYGTNDAFGGQLAPEQIAENLGLMADMVREAGATPIIATLLPRFDEGPRERAEAVSEAIYPMARLRGITICDFQKLFPDDPNLFSDFRLHPNQEGYEKMADYWFPALATFEGDVDRSLVIDDKDLLLLTAVFQTRRGSWGFNPDADFNDDGHVDVADLTVLLLNIGRSFLPVNLYQ